MAGPVPAATLTLLASFVYRIVLNLPDVPFSADLRKPQSSEFKQTAEIVTESVDFLLRSEPAYRNTSVAQFRYQQVVGTMVIFDVTFAAPYSGVKKAFEEATRAGVIGSLVVSPDGFEFTELAGNHSVSRPTQLCADGSDPEFSLHGSMYCWSHSVCPSGTACLDRQCCRTPLVDEIRQCPETQWECGLVKGICIPLHYRCDGLNDCEDHSDEQFCGKHSVNS